jgi:Ser/Thr protein kinase RdoA (MazF antagonist)
MDLARLASQFGGQVFHASLIQTGINKTYRIDGCGTAPRYLRLYRKTGRSLEEIDFELHLLQHISDLNLVRVTRPIPDVHGNVILEIFDEGEPRIACMFEAAEGRAPGSNVDDMRRLGQALASLHNATRQVCVPYSRPINLSSVIRESIIALQQLG